MILSSIYRASQKKRLSRTLCSFAQSVIEPLSLDSPADCKTTTASHQPQVYCKGFQTLNGSQKHLWVRNSEFPKEKYSHCYLMIQQMSTSSHVVKATTTIGKVPPTDRNESTIQSTWFDKYLPTSARPYAYLARLDKPIGIWLLAWPCMWSITMAGSQGHLPDLKMIALFGCGSLLLRGAGCTINDIVDKTTDEKVERTRLRPIASGLITKFQGGSFAASQFLLGLGVLLQLNDYSQVLGASSLPLIATYPFMKRFTYWPQAHLGLTYSWGALLGWSAVKGSLDPIIVLPLYLSGVFWTLVYDTIYAHQDKQDDKKVGVKSTALLFEDRTKYWVSGFGSACISSLLLSGYNAEIGRPFYVFVMAASGQLAWQIWTVDLSRPADCNKKFLSNKWFGAIVFSGILIGKLSS